MFYHLWYIVSIVLTSYEVYPLSHPPYRRPSGSCHHAITRRRFHSSQCWFRLRCMVIWLTSLFNISFRTLIHLLYRFVCPCPFPCLVQVHKLLKALHVCYRFTAVLPGQTLPPDVEYFGMCLLGHTCVGRPLEALHQSVRNALLYLDVSLIRAMREG